MKMPWLKDWSYPGLFPSDLVFSIFVHIQALRFHFSQAMYKTWPVSQTSLLTLKGVPLPFVP